jgi:hypothetical protein
MFVHAVAVDSTDADDDGVNNDADVCPRSRLERPWTAADTRFVEGFLALDRSVRAARGRAALSISRPSIHTAVQFFESGLITAAALEAYILEAALSACGQPPAG